MNHTLLHSPFQLDYPASSDSEYIAPERAFASSTTFSTEDTEGDHRGADSAGPQLAQPSSVPVTNGFRYTAQHSAVQNVHFHAASGLVMSPVESSSGSASTSPSSATSSFAYASISNTVPSTASSSEGFCPPSSVYSHTAALQWNDRMTDFRLQRVPALQPPSGMSPPLQSQGTIVPGSTGLMSRSDSYSSMPYTMNRNTFSPSHNATLGDMSRYSQYSTTRPVDISSSASAGSMYNHPATTMLLESPTRSQTMIDAPPFHDTNVLHQVVTPSGQTINPEIQAKIHKGFFQVDDKWTCYRRNYFSVSCSFSLRPWTPNVALYVQLPNHTTESVRSFSMSISAIVNGQDNETRELVQHTPKRDKQSERKPGKVTLQPQQPPSLLNHGSSVGPGHITFGAPPHTSGVQIDYGAYGAPQQPSPPPTSHTFERIQFQKATANNGKRRAQQQYYNLVVELYAEVANSVGNGVDSQLVLIARKLSHPMVVRGRSPGHYKDNRRDSSASMGPDGGAGNSRDGNGGGLRPGIAHGPHSHLGLMSYDPHRGGSRFDYRRMTSTDHSPLAASPLVSSSSSSPGFEYGIISDSMNPMEAIKDATTVEPYTEPSFTGAPSDVRKVCIEQPSVRMHMTTFEEEPSTKAEENDGTFNEVFDTMIPTNLHNETGSSSQYLKWNGAGSYLNHTHRESPGPKFGGSYAGRSRESSYGRFDAIPNPPSLCS